ncbi:ABC transporter substrate binding protein [Poseidonibacter sp.]|uniref:sensor histidine kinase n=1 Tax=Poseidonibacter sp. TaxID=2321188 RepID=UPI003C7872E5
MKKLLLLLILFNSYLFANKSILIINSYHKGYEWSDKIIQGIEKEFYSYDNIDTSTLYMDSKRVTSNEYILNLENLYKIQLKNRKYDLIIVIDRFAYDFVLKSYKNLFTNEPILALGLENFSRKNLQKYNLEDKVSVLLEKRDLKGNTKVIQTLIPSIKKLYIINDKSTNAEHTEPLIKEFLDNFKGKYKLIYLKENNLDDLSKMFEKFEENTAALFIRFYKDSNGKLYKNNTISKFIQNSKIPIFVTDSMFIKKGAIGGRIIDLSIFGKTSGQMALDILENNKTNIKVFDELYYVFDALKLDQFTLAVNQLNDSYKIVNKRVTFYDKNRGFINFVFTISPILILLIIGLFHNIYLRKNTEKKLRQRIEFDSVLLNAIESPIFWQDDKGKIIDSNVKFCNFLELPSSKIYGKSLTQLENKNADIISDILEKYKKDKDKNNRFKYKISNDKKKIYFIKQASYCDSKTKIMGTVTIFTDITKEIENEKDNEKNQQFIIQQSKLAEIGEIFSSIAHQWKSPLVEITTIAQESFYNSNTDVLENQSYVKDIMTQVNYMNDTINDFQSFIVPSNKKSIFNAYDAIKSMLDIVEHNIKYNYIKINIDLKEDTNLNICGFRNEFKQSILNIVNNAKDELLNNEYKNRKIDMFFYNKNNKLIIKINDNAGGIKQKNIKKIFKAYYSTKKDGHGIGLYMVKMIIEDKMNGKLKVQNVKEGASFTIELESIK